MAVVYLAGLVLAGAHESTSFHVRCAEHGELTHLAPEAQRLADVGPVKAPRMASDDAVSGDAHDHCQLASALERREVTRRPTATATVSLPPPATVAPGTKDQRHWPQRLAALVSAPKTSPPIG